jgi:hypothetical protein
MKVAIDKKTILFSIRNIRKDSENFVLNEFLKQVTKSLTRFEINI